MTLPRALKERGLSVSQFQQDLRSCVKVWGSPARFGAAIGTGGGNVSNQMMGYQPATAPMCEKLYGPGHGNRLIVRAPGGTPIDRKWVDETADELANALKGAPTPEYDAAEVDEDEADVRRLLAAAGIQKRAEQNKLAGVAPVDQPAAAAPEGVGDRATPAPSTISETLEPEPQPSNPDASGELAGPVACGSTPEAEGASGAGSEEAGAEDGAPASTLSDVETVQEGPASDGVAAILNVSDFLDAETLRVQGVALAVRQLYDRYCRWAGRHRATLCSQVYFNRQLERQGYFLRRGRELEVIGLMLVATLETEAAAAAATPEPLPVAPWSKLEDVDLVAILRGKLAELEAEDAANEARHAELQREAAAVQALRLDLEVKRDRLARAIEIFEPDAAQGICGQQEGTDNGEDSLEAQAAE